MHCAANTGVQARRRYGFRLPAVLASSPPSRLRQGRCRSGNGAHLGTEARSGGSAAKRSGLARQRLGGLPSAVRATARCRCSWATLSSALGS